VRWSVPLESIFGPGHSTSTGWDFGRYAADDLYIGYVGPRLTTTRTDQPIVTDLTQLGTAGISASTGRRVWFIPNSIVHCSGTIDIVESADAEPLPVLCRYAGTETFDPARGTSSLSGPTTLFGFDPPTGNLTWQWSTNGDASLVNSEKPHVQVDDHSVVLPDRSGAPFVVDLRSGASRPASPTTTGWCAARVRFRFGAPFYGTPPTNERAGGVLSTPCRNDGSPAPLPGQIPHAFAATAGDVVAFASPSGVVAFRRG
jgi:hypothetical protein